ncbi:MAG: ATP-binding cassette domain-containing protein [Balneolaceae bacterium]
MNYSATLLIDRIFYQIADNVILKEVSAAVHPGKITAIIGECGSGKSILLKIVAGQVAATGGVTRLDGKTFQKKSLFRRFKTIGYLPQRPMLPDEFSVERVLRTMPKTASGNFLDDKVISTIRKERVGALSAGERRYLELSVICSLPRKYLLLDEPMTAVEPVFAELIQKKIREAASAGKGVLVTDFTHRYVSELADHFYLLDKGECHYLDGDLTIELVNRGFLK